MATGGEFFALPGLLATGSLAAAQYYPVKPSTTAGYVKVATAAADKVIGILQNDPTAGQAALVAVHGLCKGIAGSASVAAGDRLTVNSSGLLPTTTGGNNVVAVALEASSAIGDIISVFVSLSTMGD